MTPRRDAGFTLIELVVALGLAGIVSLLLLNGIRLATGGLDRLNRETDRLDRHRGAALAVRQALATAVPVGGGARGFAGGPDRVKFLTLVEEGGPGVYLVDIALDTGRAEHPLVLTRRLAKPFGEPRVQQSVLAWHVRDFRLAYYGTAKPGDEPAWQERWESVASLPKLVRLTIAADDGVPEPPITVRLWSGG